MAHNNIVDKGWSQMENLLHKEMPEKKNKKLLWFWMLTAFVVLLTISAYLLYDKDKKQPSQQIPIETPLVSSQKNGLEKLPLKTENSPKHTSLNTLNPNQESSNSKISLDENNSLVQTDNQSVEASSKKVKNLTLQTKQEIELNVKMNNTTKADTKSFDDSILPKSDQTKETTEDLKVLNPSTSKNKVFAETNKELIKSSKSIELDTKSITSKTTSPSELIAIEDTLEDTSDTINSESQIVVSERKPILKHELYFTAKSYPIQWPTNFEAGYNYHFIAKKGLGIFASIGLLSNYQSIDYIAKDASIGEEKFDPTTIISEDYSTVYLKEHFANLGITNKRRFAVRAGIGFEIGLYKNISVQNITALYYYLNTNRTNSLTANQAESQLKENSNVLSNSTSICYSLNKQFDLNLGYQFSITPEYEISLIGDNLKSNSKEIVLGLDYKF